MPPHVRQPPPPDECGPPTGDPPGARGAGGRGGADGADAPGERIRRHVYALASSRSTHDYAVAHALVGPAALAAVRRSRCYRHGHTRPEGMTRVRFDDVRARTPGGSIVTGRLVYPYGAASLYLVPELAGETVVLLDAERVGPVLDALADARRTLARPFLLIGPPPWTRLAHPNEWPR